MKKLFAILAVMGVLTLGSVQPVMAQDAAPALSLIHIWEYLKIQKSQLIRNTLCMN